MQSPPGLAPLGGSSSELPQQLSMERGVNFNDRAFGSHPSTLTVGKEKPPAVRTCRADYLKCTALTHENQLVSNTTGRKYFAMDVKPDNVHYKLQNYIYLLMCTHCGIQYVGESITLLNLRMDIHRRAKPGYEISINY